MTPTPQQDTIRAIANVLRDATRIVVMAGAGMSAQSGIPTVDLLASSPAGHRWHDEIVEAIRPHLNWEQDARGREKRSPLSLRNVQPTSPKTPVHRGEHFSCTARGCNT